MFRNGGYERQITAEDCSEQICIEVCDGQWIATWNNPQQCSGSLIQECEDSICTTIQRIPINNHLEMDEEAKVVDRVASDNVNAAIYRTCDSIVGAEHDLTLDCGNLDKSNAVYDGCIDQVYRDWITCVDQVTFNDNSHWGRSTDEVFEEMNSVKPNIKDVPLLLDILSILDKELDFKGGKGRVLSATETGNRVQYDTRSTENIPDLNNFIGDLSDKSQYGFKLALYINVTDTREGEEDFAYKIQLIPNDYKIGFYGYSDTYAYSKQVKITDSNENSLPFTAENLHNSSNSVEISDICETNASDTKSECINNSEECTRAVNACLIHKSGCRNAYDYCQANYHNEGLSACDEWRNDYGQVGCEYLTCTSDYLVNRNGNCRVDVHNCMKSAGYNAYMEDLSFDSNGIVVYCTETIDPNALAVRIETVLPLSEWVI